MRLNANETRPCCGRIYTGDLCKRYGFHETELGASYAKL